MGIQPVDVEWLVLLVNAYAPMTQAAAGDDAVSPRRADEIQPAGAMNVTAPEKRRLAEDLWPVFGAPTTSERVAALEALVTAGELSPHVDAHARVGWSTRRVEAGDVLAAGCAAALLEAVTAFGWDRLGTCAGCACVDVYVDQAGRTPRKYCSHTCLNRARVRAFRSRRANPRPS